MAWAMGNAKACRINRTRTKTATTEDVAVKLPHLNSWSMSLLPLGQSGPHTIFASLSGGSPGSPVLQQTAHLREARRVNFPGLWQHAGLRTPVNQAESARLERSDLLSWGVVQCNTEKSMHHIVRHAVGTSLAGHKLVVRDRASSSLKSTDVSPVPSWTGKV